MPNADIQDLRDRLAPVFDVRAAIGVLSWDQEVNMPPKGAMARGRQLATLSGIAHRLFTDPKLGELLKRLRDVAGLSSDERKLVSETLHDYDRATKLPERFVQSFTEETSKAFQAWVAAKRDSNFNAFRPHLETLVGLCREKADLLGYEGSPYNALLDEFERGMTAERLRPLFAELATRQSALIAKIVKSPRRADLAWLKQEWDTKKQWDFTIRLLKDMGYDFDAGRQDASEHPFTTEFDVHDVRVTTRCYPDKLFPGFSASMHEGGHALYEQGMREEDRRTPLGQAISLGIHESQSRLWENLVGQSRPFWDRYGRVLRDYFPEQLADVSDETIYRAVNHVEPTLRRLDADECTYNLHIILRFEIEVDLIEGRLAVADIPGKWDELMKRYLGLEVPDDARGCLQDVHWSHGAIGYFPTYTLGNLYAAQMIAQIERDVPQLWDHVRQGDFSPLLGWLRRNVHTVGRRKTAEELVRDATKREPGSQAYLEYLEKKYGDLYAV
jgi:carboxypeptidase Taq